MPTANAAGPVSIRGCPKGASHRDLRRRRPPIRSSPSRLAVGMLRKRRFFLKKGAPVRRPQVARHRRLDGPRVRAAAAARHARRRRRRLPRRRHRAPRATFGDVFGAGRRRTPRARSDRRVASETSRSDAPSGTFRKDAGPRRSPSARAEILKKKKVRTREALEGYWAPGDVGEIVGLGSVSGPIHLKLPGDRRCRARASPRRAITSFFETSRRAPTANAPGPVSI